MAAVRLLLNVADKKD